MIGIYIMVCYVVKGLNGVCYIDHQRARSLKKGIQHHHGVQADVPSFLCPLVMTRVGVSISFLTFPPKTE